MNLVLTWVMYHNIVYRHLHVIICKFSLFCNVLVGFYSQIARKSFSILSVIFPLVCCFILGWCVCVHFVIFYCFALFWELHAVFVFPASQFPFNKHHGIQWEQDGCMRTSKARAGHQKQSGQRAGRSTLPFNRHWPYTHSGRLPIIL